MSPIWPFGQGAAGGSCSAGSHAEKAIKMLLSIGTVISPATRSVCRAVDGTYTAYTSSMYVNSVRTSMSGFASMSTTNAIAENAAVPTKRVASSTTRTNWRDRGAPRSSSHNNPNAALATNSSALLRLKNERRPARRRARS